MSKDDARKAGKTDDAAKPLSDDEAKDAVGGTGGGTYTPGVGPVLTGPNTSDWLGAVLGPHRR